MSLTPTSYGDNPFQPGATAATYIPDQLIAGNEHLVTDTLTLLEQTAVLPRGTLLGKITATGKLTVCKQTAEDGSQTPHSILVDAADATASDVLAGVYLKGEFNVNRMTIDASWGGSLAAQVLALQALCRGAQLYLKQSLSADDPTENNAAGV